MTGITIRRGFFKQIPLTKAPDHASQSFNRILIIRIQISGWVHFMGWADVAILSRILVALETTKLIKLIDFYRCQKIEASLMRNASEHHDDYCCRVKSVLIVCYTR